MRPSTAAVVLAALVMLVGACSAAKPAAEVIFGAELPCGPPAEADGSFERVALPDDAVPSVAEINELLIGPVSTEFDPSQPVIVIDDRGFPLVLGPAWPIEVAKVTPSESSFPPSSCQFELSLSEQGLETFNVVAALCFERSARCPTGQLAVVADGQLVSAPTIQSRRFDQPEVVISSPSIERTPQENLALAESLAGPAQFRLVISDGPPA